MKTFKTISTVMPKNITKTKKSGRNFDIKLF